jgi:hypothetical protein
MLTNSSDVGGLALSDVGSTMFVVRMLSGTSMEMRNFDLGVFGCMDASMVILD